MDKECVFALLDDLNEGYSECINEWVERGGWRLPEVVE